MERFIVKCLSIILFIAIPCEPAKLRCFNGSLNEYTAVPLSGLPALLASPCLDSSRPTVIYTFGFRGRPNGPATTAVLSAYLATKKRNVILLDWKDEAASGLLGTAFSYAMNAVPNSERIGNELGDALTAAVLAGVNLRDIHLIGHSLGAHLMGSAGRRARKNGFTIPRITGFDPARALYEAPLRLRNGLDRTCANFVDIIHTDPGKYGLRESYGTVDIWPNYGAANSQSQPGCPAGNFDNFSNEDLCSHDRSWRFYVESIANPTGFPMASASSYDMWVLRSLQEPEDQTATLFGELISTKARGNYYLSTNAAKPFARGKFGLTPTIRLPVSQSSSRLRRTSPMRIRTTIYSMQKKS